MASKTKVDCPVCGREDVALYLAKGAVEKSCMACVRKAGKPSKPAAKKLPAKPKDTSAPAEVTIGGAIFREPPSTLSITFVVPIPAGTTALELMDIIRALPAGAVVA